MSDGVRTKNRAEWVTCILRTRADLPRGTTWCGTRTSCFTFQSIDHAAENGAQEGRLTVCPQCRKAVMLALRNKIEAKT